MKKQTSVLVLAIALTIASCGPNQAELQAREKIKMDSVSKVATEALLSKQRQDSIVEIARVEARSTAVSDSIANEISASMNNEVCKEIRAQLSAAEDKLTELKGFKLGRLASEKEQQLTDQYRLIEDLKDQLKSCH